MKTKQTKTARGSRRSGHQTEPIQAEESLSPAAIAQIWERRARLLAEEPPAPPSGETLNLLVFQLQDDHYAIEATYAQEIYLLQHLTLVPRTPNFVVGVFSARGRIVPIIDLRAFFGLPASPVNTGGQGGTGQSKIVVVTNTDPTSDIAQSPLSQRPTEFIEVGILADEVADVITVFKEEIEPPLTVHSGSRAEHFHGITRDMLVVLNLEGLLNDPRLIVHEELL